jgi:hypothetical protein
MAIETTVRLRDQRKPGHLWVDNEIYDVFGDELRQDGISVYSALARMCYGVSVTMSLREMAAHARMSKDTFARTLKRVIELGLVLERKGSTPQSPSTYSLVDVKELAQGYLRAAVEEQKRKSVSPRDTSSSVTLVDLLSRRADECMDGVAAGDGSKCLTLRQMGDFAGLDDSATEVSQNGGGFATEVSQAVRHLRQDTRHKTKNKYPPTPASGGSGTSFDSRPLGGEGLKSSDGGEVANGPRLVPDPGEGDVEEQVLACGHGVTAGAKAAAQLVWAAERVMRECDFTPNARLERVIGDALGLRCGKMGCSAEDAADLAIRNKHEFTSLESQGLLRHSWGWNKFFAGGHWLGSGWPIDRARLDQARGAGVGMR